MLAIYSVHCSLLIRIDKRKHPVRIIISFQLKLIYLRAYPERQSETKLHVKVDLRESMRVK